MSRFIIITDTHLALKMSNRTGSFLEDCLAKIAEVIDMCNETGAILLHAGDVFHSSTVPDIVKSSLVDLIRNRLKTKMYVIYGNHDLSYGSYERSDYTSLGLLIKSGVVELLDKPIFFEGFSLRSGLPVENAGVQLCLAHKYFNYDNDPVWSCGYNDLPNGAEGSVLVLGHDHIEYDPLEHKGITVIRPGSLSRITRDDYRNHVNVTALEFVDGRFTVSVTSLLKSSREYDMLFRSSTGVDVTKYYNSALRDLPKVYAEIAERLKGAASSEMEFDKVLTSVTDNADVLAYIRSFV